MILEERKLCIDDSLYLKWGREVKVVAKPLIKDACRIIAPRARLELATPGS